MNTRTKRIPASKTLLIACGLALTLAANAEVIGPWPVTHPYMWHTKPFTPVAGTNWLEQPGAVDNLVMGSLGTGSKNAWWLPYGSLSGSAWQEKMCIAQLTGSANTPLTNIHVKILDQATVGKHGWAVILKDNQGRILDFGVRAFYARAFIAPHQWDGTNWVNYSGGWSPQYERPRYGADYYTMDFTQNGDGTVNWTIVGENGPGGTNFLESTTGTTSIAYGNITEVYLNASTTDATTQNYKWTEFSVTPAVTSPPPLSVTQAAPDFLLSWPSPWTTNFVLQANEDLSTANWTAVTNEPVDDLTTITVTVPSLPGNRVFRLKLP